MQNTTDIIRQKFRSGDYKAMQEKAREYLEGRGWIQLPLGSFKRWIYADWFAKALEEGVVKENVYGLFVPVADVRVNSEVVGQRGREEIVERKEVLDFSRFFNFMERYGKFEYAKQKEQEERDAITSIREYRRDE